MKKLLLLFCALLCLGVSEGWGQVTEITDGARYYMRFRQSTGWYVTPPTSGSENSSFSQTNSSTKVKAIFRFDKVAEGTYTIFCVNNGKYVKPISTTASSSVTDAKITFSATSYNWKIDAGSVSGSWKIHPNENTAVSWDPWNSSSYMAEHALTLVNNRSEGDIQLMDASSEIAYTTYLQTNYIYAIDLYHSSNGSRWWTSSAGATHESGSAGLYKLESYSGGYYIKEVTSGKYVYAKNLSSVTTLSNPTAYGYSSATGIGLGSTSLPTGATSETPSENLKYYKWVVDATTTGGKWYIKPSENTNTALAINSYSHAYVSYYLKEDGTYAWAEARFELPSINSLLNNQVAFSDIVALGYSIKDIRSQLITNYTPTQTDKLGHPSASGWTTFQSTVNAFTTSSTYDDLDDAVDALWATVIYPSDGYYYIKGKAYSNYMFIDPSTFTTTGNLPLLNDEQTAKHVWKITADGSSLTVKSSTGGLITNTKGSTIDPITLESAYANNYSSAYGYFYFNHFHSPNPSSQAKDYSYSGSSYNSTTNPMKVLNYTNRAGDGNYWTFVDASDSYDIYDVVIEDGLQLNPSVTCTLEGYTGNTVVYDGGFYAFTKGTEISSSDFTPQSSDLDGYNTESTTVTVDSEKKTITVVYVPTTSYSDLIAAYDTEHGITAKVTQSFVSAIGYPKTTTTGYLGLYSILGKGSGYTAQDYIDIQNYYTQYLAETEIYLPLDGYTYTFTNIQKDGKKKYLYASGANLAVATLAENASIPESGRFVAHTLPDDKYFFVAKGTNYHFVIARSGNTAMFNGFDSGYSPIALIPMPSSVTNTTNDTYSYSVNKEDVLGLFYINGKRRDGTNNGIIIVANASDAFDAFIKFPVYHNNFSTAFKIERVGGVSVETYYNTVNMRRAGDHSYASTYLPFAVLLPENVKAYKGSTPIADVMAMTKVADGNDDENNILPALTAAILYSDGAAITGNTTLPIVSSALTAPVDNALSGTLADNTAVSATTYVLYGDASSAGFYPLNGTTAPTCKAYYDAGAAGVKSFRFDFGDMTDGIKAISNSKEPMANSQIFNLAGQRISKLQRGVNIVNGKKVVVK